MASSLLTHLYLTILDLSFFLIFQNVYLHYYYYYYAGLHSLDSLKKKAPTSNNKQRRPLRSRHLQLLHGILEQIEGVD